MGYLCCRIKLDKCEVTVIYNKYPWISKQINLLCTCLSPSWPLCGCLHGSFFSNYSWCKQRRMGPKVKQITLWNQARNLKLIWYSKNWSIKEVLPSISSLSLCILQKNSVILTCVDDCIIVSQKHETITSLTKSLNNDPEIMRWKMKEIYQIILELTSRKNEMEHSNYCNRICWRKLSTMSELKCSQVSKK